MSQDGDTFFFCADLHFLASTFFGENRNFGKGQDLGNWHHRSCVSGGKQAFCYVVVVVCLLPDLRQPNFLVTYLILYYAGHFPLALASPRLTFFSPKYSVEGESGVTIMDSPGSNFLYRLGVSAWQGVSSFLHKPGNFASTLNHSWLLLAFCLSMYNILRISLSTLTWHVTLWFNKSLPPKVPALLP